MTKAKAPPVVNSQPAAGGISEKRTAIAVLAEEISSTDARSILEVYCVSLCLPGQRRSSVNVSQYRGTLARRNSQLLPDPLMPPWPGRVQNSRSRSGINFTVVRSTIFSSGVWATTHQLLTGGTSSLNMGMIAMALLWPEYSTPQDYAKNSQQSCMREWIKQHRKETDKLFFFRCHIAIDYQQHQ